MKVVVTPNSKIPIRGLLSRPFVDEKVLDLTEMQIKRVLGFGAKVHVVSQDGIKGEITLVNGQLNTDAIKATLELVGEADHPVESKTSEVAQLVKTDEPEVAAETASNTNPYQHMTKAQRRAARRAEAQQKAEESAKEVEETTVESAEEVSDADEDAAKDNVEVIEAEEEKVEEV